MHSSTIVLPLLAFAASVLAAPTPLEAVARAVPNVHEVIRNPAPIDNRFVAKLQALGLLKTDVVISTRAVPKVETEIDDPSKIV